MRLQYIKAFPLVLLGSLVLTTSFPFPAARAENPSHSTCTWNSKFDSLLQLLKVSHVTGNGSKLAIDRFTSLHKSSFSLTQNTIVLLDSEKLFKTSVNIDETDGSIVIKIELDRVYRSAFRILNETINGEVNGRKISHVPLTNSPTLSFVDGKPPPNIPPAITALFNDLAASFEILDSSVSAAAARCNTSVENLEERDYASSLSRRQAMIFPHISLTQNSVGCIACQTGAAAVLAGVCTAVCAATFFTFGIGCAACIAIATADFISAQNICLNSPICCPNDCVPEIPFTQGGLCCNSDESCAGTSGFCCPSGTSPVLVSPDVWECCVSGISCANTCCDQGQSCINNVCCANEKVCGNACCSASACCGGFGPVCIEGGTLNGGVCCPPGNFVVCGGVCCSGSCSPEGACLRTPAQCQAIMKPPCLTLADCPGGFNVCSGGCCDFLA